MHLFFVTQIIRAIGERASEGALAIRRTNEWEIYQQDLEISRQLAQTNTQVNQEIRRFETIHCPCQTPTRTT